MLPRQDYAACVTANDGGAILFHNRSDLFRDRTAWAGLVKLGHQSAVQGDIEHAGTKSLTVVGENIDTLDVSGAQVGCDGLYCVNVVAVQNDLAAESGVTRTEFRHHFLRARRLDDVLDLDVEPVQTDGERIVRRKNKTQRLRCRRLRLQFVIAARDAVDLNVSLASAARTVVIELLSRTQNLWLIQFYQGWRTISRVVRGPQL